MAEQQRIAHALQFPPRAADRSADAAGVPATKRAVIHRMATPEHVCPYGRKAVALLRRRGYQVEDRPLRSRAETDAFKAHHGVETTPQIFIEGERIGGYDALKRRLGLRVADKDAVTYTPVLAIFGAAALAALAMSWAAYGDLLTPRAAEWFIAFAMVILGVQKLRDLSGFSSGFLNYDLLSQRWVPYAYLYPFLETGAGVLMIAGALTWLSAPVALSIGTVGAVSVFKAVYIDRRTLKCACVGGNSNVPLGFVSLTENVMMVGMAVWMGAMALA